MRLKSKMIATAAAAIAALVSSQPAEAAAKQVNVTLPGFQVTLNGHAVDSSSREYPLLVYKDIVYVPMTWYDGRLLGLETRWTEEEGLAVSQAPVTASYHAYESDRKNLDRFAAEIVGGKVSVNGTAINNDEEEYPLLSFRNVRYFPLTWRFAHDAFGWEYTWDSQEGLAIHSSNPQLKDVPLPSYAASNGLAFWEGHYYYTDTEPATKVIYRSPEDAPGSKSKVFEYGDGYDPVDKVRFGSFFTRDHDLWLRYHVGGATMGSNVYVQVKPDGSAEEKYSQNLDFRNTLQGTFYMDYRLPPSKGNISLLPNGDGGERIPLGSNDYYYAWDSSSGASGDLVGGGDTVVVGSQVYIKASASYDGEKQLHRINLQTKETAVITPFSITSFRVHGDRLYYVKTDDGKLYRSDLDGKQEQAVTDKGPVKWYGQVGDGLYYAVEQEPGKHALYRAKGEAGQPDQSVSKLLFKSMQFLDQRIVAQTADNDAYNYMIFDATGHVQAAVVDSSDLAFIGADRLLFSDQGEGTVKVLRLP